MDRLLVTGSGRCGTKYAATLLNRLGLKCSHEQVYTPEGFVGWGNFQAACSWMAAPFLAEHDGPIVHLTRDPLAVVNSWVGIGVFERRGSTPHLAFLRKHSPELWNEYGPVEMAMRHVVTWNERIEPHVWVRLAVESIVSFLPTNINAGTRRSRLSWEDVLPLRWGGELRALANRYGYE